VLATLGFAGLPAVPAVLVTGLTLAAGFTILAAFAFLAAEHVFDEPSTRRVDAGRERDGVDRRRLEIRAYLASIDEPFREDHEIAGRRVAFFLPERDVAVTFDARTYFRIERARADADSDAADADFDVEDADSDTGDAASVRAVLCEHEMPGRNLGARLPFDVPTESTDTERPASRAVRDAYAELGLTPGADVDAVRRAYRERVKDAHPDHGGSERAFRRVRDAYATASTHATEGDAGVEGDERSGASPTGPGTSVDDRHRGRDRDRATASAHAR
jgi:hypothetical protein